ncbi:MAG: hypothetical protein A3G45_00990 [Candidatus Staskawiczbacteria bacterium RIFCSPLOWO2_12_FULL_37_15]|uniref:Uncharacterized protein n=1 Tax=Candidatus Staskawiczbacteria bacterium RIFCSPLOWO2_12_FULL_37_15 TaxID=1802218 RepID=A0A1G2ILE0_9BACT|nr:MAG: hypothetical protein US35_C0002G0002 [Parcubacteria group bacterium GW2011_GWA2_37_10]OGZ75331.1 MAG: hypothetical protein A3G45_00990 [Candidatus Staskawiczbacteria bacterium RIFCSPLOWO2_12_FULL_37_15]
MIDDKDIEKLEESLVTKKEFEGLMEVVAMKDDLKKYATKDDVVEFKDEILKGQDEIIGKLDKLLGEKTMGDAQDKRKTKILEIHNNALKSNKILSEKDSAEIDNLRVF